MGGVTFNFVCKDCGYRVDSIAFGYGMKSIYCNSCKRPTTRPLDFEGNILEKYNKCACGASDWSDWDAKSCPKCGSKNGGLEEGGWWF